MIDHKMDKIDEFLVRHDESGGAVIVHPRTRKLEKLSAEEVDLVEKLRRGTFYEPGIDYFPEYIDYFSGERMRFPISGTPDPKRRFLPSVGEYRKVSKLIAAIRKGLYHKKPEKRQIVDLWSFENSESFMSQNQKKRQKRIISAPKIDLPDTHESYHPPLEYLPDDSDIKKWERMEEEEKRGEFLSTNFDCLRHVPVYNLISQHFDRCLDLYVAPRKQKLVSLVEPEDLLPALPDISELKPFPSWECVAFSGHNSKITAFGVHKSGEFLMSADASGNLIIWEHIGVKLEEYKLKIPVNLGDWNPRKDIYVFLIACQTKIIIQAFDHGDEATMERQISLLSTKKDSESFITWKIKKSKTPKIVIDHLNEIVAHNWHPNGDYFLTMVNKDSKNQIIMHQLSKSRSQTFYKASKNIVNAIFHTEKPAIFIINKRYVRLIELKTQNVLYKLSPGVDQISYGILHPSGNHFVTGSEDYRLCWFDVEASTKPYRVFRIFKSGISEINLHSRYPLMACSSHESTLTVFHSNTYEDVAKRPLIMPIKVLKPKKLDYGSPITKCRFHPYSPSLFTCDEAGVIRLFQ